MGYSDIGFEISDEVRGIGLNGCYFAMGGMTNKLSDPEFDVIRDRVIAEVFAAFSQERIKTDPLLRGFWTLHESVGTANSKTIASPENLLKILLKSGRLPSVNLIVDIYNLISIKSRMAIGAHDIARITGNVHLRMTVGNEGFVPLGMQEQQPFKPREYAYVDDANDIICRLEVRQVEKTKVSLDTRDCFYIVQGNPATNPESIMAAADELIMLTRRFCGGEVRTLYTPSALV